MIKNTASIIQQYSIALLLVTMLLMIAALPSLVQAAIPVAGFGNALNLDGTNNYIDNGSIDFAQGAYTIEMWFNTSANSRSTIFAGTLPDVNEHGILIEIQSNGTLRYLHRQPPGNSGGTDIYTDGSYNDGQWHHIAMIKGDTNMSLYIDGALIESLSAPPNFTAAIDVVLGRLGQPKTKASRYFQGQLDEVRLWNIARTADDILANMNTVLLGTETGLISYWRFDEDSGTTATDSIGGNHATLINMEETNWIASTINPSFTTNENTPVSGTLLATDADGDSLTYTLVDDDNGAAVITDASTGAFTYTPTTSGTRTFSYKVNDIIADSNIATVSIEIIPGDNNAPTFTSTEVTLANQDQSYTYDITTDDVDGDNVTLTAPTLPDWLTFTDNGDGTAILTGIPTEAGINYDVTLRVNDGTVDVEQSFTIVVEANQVNNEAPIFTSTPLTTVEQNTTYSYSITTSDANVGDELTITAPLKPDWLTFTDNGDGTAILTGIPIEAGINYDVTLRVNDGSVDVDQSFIVIAIETPPTPTTPPPTPSTMNANPNNFGGQAITGDVSIEENRSISNVVFEGEVVENGGVVSNSTISSNTILTGGKLTGTITNEGTIADTNFVGIKLEGGTLSGTVVNSSKVGGIIENVVLAEGTVLKGGKVGGEITGNPDNPPLITATEIKAGSELSYVRLSPTVELPKDVVLGDGVILPNDPPTLADFGLTSEDIAQLDMNTLANLEPAIFNTLTTEDVAQIPPAAFAALAPAQIAEIEKAALEAMTIAQFEQLPVDTLSGLTAENMGGLPIAIINQLAPEHLKALDVKEFQKMPSGDISRLLTNLDANKITPQNVENMLPKTWAVDLETGALTVPVNTAVTFKSLLLSLGNVTLPTVSDMYAGFGIGGGGAPLIEETQRSLTDENLADFVLSQDEHGILLVEGTGDAAGVRYTFIPDADNAIVVDTDKMPIGLSTGAGGFYTITTPEGLQFKVVPAPQNPVVFSQSLGGGEVVIGKHGDVMVELVGRTRRGWARRVMIMDPFIEPAPEQSLCREIIPGVVICDSEVIPPFQRSLRAKSDPVYKVVYPDNTAQTVKPTVLSPDIFIEEALKFEGVQQIVYNANGTFHALYRGKIYTVLPNFNITSRETTTDEIIEPNIVLNNNGSLTYTVAIDVEEEGKRRRRGARKILIFNPFIEPASEDLLCKELFPGKTVCDFEI